MKYKYLNIKYALINASFMFMVCATSGYAYNFLSQSGFADGTIGIIIATISICGLFGQTISGSIIDKSKTLTEKKFITGAMILTIVMAFILAFMPNNSIFMIIFTILTFMTAALSLPFFNSMAFIYEKDGQKINYGFGRGIGSAAYAVGSSLLGRLWGMMGKSIMPWYIAAFAGLSGLLMQLMPEPSKEAAEAAEKESEAASENKKKDLSYAAFLRKYNKIPIIVLSMILMYFCHMLINTYMAKIIANIMGDAAGGQGSVESVQGTVLFIAAMVELPTMFAFSKILEKVSINKIMIFAAVMYSVKHVLTWICPNVTMLYFVMVLQMFSYAALVPAAVYFANTYVNEEDRNKGQAVMGITLTCGSLLASLLGGQLFQHLGVSNVVLIGAIASCIGTALMILGIRRLEAGKLEENAKTASN